MRQACLWMLLLTSLSVNAQENPRFTLVCHPDRGGIALDTHLYVDPGSSTVNGNAATITVEEITWRRESAGSESRYSVNRKSGAMTIVASDVRSGKTLYTDSGTCVSGAEHE